MRNADVLRLLLCKTVAGVVVKTADYPVEPARQLFLVFDVHTYLEFYGELSVVGGLDHSDLASLVDTPGARHVTLCRFGEDTPCG